jgi:glucose-6-phosphate 1-dehydrogenase
MLQLLCLVAMESSDNSSERELHDRKVEVLRSVRPLKSRRARYGAGRLADGGGASGDSVPAYADEDGVDPTCGTETFVELTLGVESARWRGTQFVLRGGKALERRRKGVVIRFRPGDDNAANELWIGIDGPNNIVMRLSGEEAGRPVPLLLCGEPPAAQLSAYAQVLLDVLSGGGTLSVRGDEAEQSWRVVTPVLEAWHSNLVPLDDYPAGSNGPR